jgi:hypothetical protein
MLLGTFNRRLASRGSRRALKGSRRESAALRLDRERLTQRLRDRSSEPTPPAATPPVVLRNSEHSAIWYRSGHRAQQADY